MKVYSNKYDELPNNRFNLTQAFVMDFAREIVQNPRQSPSQVKRMFCVDRVAVKEKGITSTQHQAFYVPLHIETKTN